MIITEEELLELGACEEGLEIFCGANGDSATILEALDSNGVGDVLWYLSETRYLTSSQESDLRDFAKSEALVNINLIKPHCFESDFKLILDFLLSDSEADSAARSAYLAARSAADSAACLAARSALYTAAHSAAVSAAVSAADSAAYSAICPAVDSEARPAARLRQENKLRELFLKWERL